MSVVTITGAPFANGYIPTINEWNTNIFGALSASINDINYGQVSASLIDTAVSANSSNKVPNTAAVKTYVDGQIISATVSLGHLWGFDYNSTGSAASAQVRLIIEPGSLEISGIRYYLSAQFTATPSGLAASGSYYMYWTAPSSGYALSPTSDFSFSNTPPTKVSSERTVGLYNGSSRCFGFFRTSHSSAVLFPIIKDRQKTFFANNINISLAIGTSMADYPVAGLGSFFRSIIISVNFQGNGGAASFLYSALTSTSNGLDLLLPGTPQSGYFQDICTCPCYSGSIRVAITAAPNNQVSFIWSGFDNPW